MLQIDRCIHNFLTDKGHELDVTQQQRTLPTRLGGQLVVVPPLVVCVLVHVGL